MKPYLYTLNALSIVVMVVGTAWLALLLLSVSGEPVIVAMPQLIAAELAMLLGALVSVCAVGAIGVIEQLERQALPREAQPTP